MAVSKVILNGTTLMDVTNDTVAANNLLSGETATGADGEAVTGAYIAPTFTTQSKSVSPSESAQTVTPDTGYDGLSQVTVEPMPSGTAGTPTATKGAVSNHSVSVTPSVTNTTGYITGGTKNGSPVTVSASELVGGTKSITENGTGIDVTNYAAIDVSVSGGGSASVEEKQINFIDYDGTLLYSYTKDEIDAMSSESELPANPSHDGLTAQGWNWTLSQIKAQLTALPEGPVWVGQMYITDDGKTRIHLTVDDMTKSFWLGLAVNGTVSIDWGDNSETSALTGTSISTIKSVQHNYTTPGSYVIRATILSGVFTFYSNGISDTRLLGKYETTVDNYNRPYGGCVTAIEIGSGVTSIGTNGFIQLFNMKSLTIPNGVTSISNVAFQSCYALKSLVIPDSVTSIGSTAFNNCYTLESLIIPGGVTSIGAGAFQHCLALKYLTIPDGVNGISGSMFQHCYALESLTIPDSVTSIGAYAFQNCYALKSLIIPDGVTSISNYIFQSCYALKSLIIPDGVTSIGIYAFNNCYTLESLIIPDGVTSIGSSTFYNCYALKSLNIPDGVTSIGGNAFYNCYALKSLTIPDGVTSIGSNAFNACYALKSLTIPDSVTSIGSTAFGSCYNVEEYHLLPTTPPTLGTSAFNNIQPDTKIYVPVGSLEAYQTATNWSTYASYMEEEPA